ncbi:MAG: NAD(P) transhydrogenase subunit alpha [Myxococcota bacterium]
MTLTVTALIASITLFVMAIFLGFELITKVPPTLHTPLMSGANAISGISIVGALLLSNVEFSGLSTETAGWIAFGALVLATINVVGGFAVTQRMLQMIAGRNRRPEKEKA